MQVCPSQLSPAVASRDPAAASLILQMTFSNTSSQIKKKIVFPMPTQFTHAYIRYQGELSQFKLNKIQQ